MNKDDMKQPEQPAIDVAQEPTGDNYFFPNDGGVTSFSCRADSRKEAEERNVEHLKELQKETD